MDKEHSVRQTQCFLIHFIGETYAAIDLHTSDDVAIKVEKLDNKKMVLKLEVIALKKLQGILYNYLF